MNSLVLSALALMAGGGTPAAEGSDGWLSLDREIANLSTALAPQDNAGPKISAWIKTSYERSDDVDVGGNDLGGFFVDSLRVTVRGMVGDYELKLQGEGASGGNLGSFNVRDAYVRFPVVEYVHAILGNFKSPFLFSAYSSDERLVFFDRTTIGGAFTTRELGLLLEGRFDQFLVWLSAQNGDDLQGDELLFMAKASFFSGEPITKQSGGYGPDQQTLFTAGVGWVSDENEDDATALSAEAMLASGPWWAHAEVVDVDDGFLDAAMMPTIQNGLLSRIDNVGFNDATPWDATVAYMFSEQWEVAVRVEDFDDDDDTMAYWGGVNYYVEGHAAKWQLNYITTDSDDSAKEIDLLLLGLVVAI